MEIWKPLKDNSRYEVSNLGRLKSISRVVKRKDPRTNKILTYNYKERISNGYLKNKQTKVLTFTLRKDNKSYKKIASRLVLETFVGEPPEGMVCCHNNGNPMDNSLGNLRWDTCKSNTKDMIEHGTRLKGEQVHCAKLTEDEVLSIRSYSPRRGLYKDLAKYYNVSCDTIRSIIKKRSWKHV